ncbi:phosphoserine phosphatase [Vibrio sp. SM6]|uniref:Phosphoserine phosphatase n=1 Tax=Vibrio agarilyticus TaxID=2726741 RepID=A0A7X8YGR5_9VIBR|nr:phosphoserine phosphatase [Vibrio agarilyticus]NLS12701.1 phosphoserine phosphatase [Vibrio agarilyticus]
MDMLNTLPICRHTSFLHRFPEIHLATQHDRRQAGWIVFASHLTVAHFDTLTERTGIPCRIVDAWRVGSYEVALMAGELSIEQSDLLPQLGLDFAKMSEVPDLSKPGLIVFDMDSTVIQIECIDEIAKLAGVGEQVAAVTERAMQGELDFEQSLRQRVGQLAGAHAGILEEVRQSLPLMPDLLPMMNTLKAYGWKTAIASGGFTYFSDHLKSMLGLDYAQSNQLEIVDQVLTGNVLGEVVSAQTKAEILVALAEQYGVELHNTVAVGDGANDLVMMAEAGLGIAYHAKPKVEAQAQCAIRFTGLGGVICILSGALARQQKVSWQRKP